MLIILLLIARVMHSVIALDKAHEIHCLLHNADIFSTIADELRGKFASFDWFVCCYQ